MQESRIVYGIHAVREALCAHTGNQLYLQENSKGKPITQLQQLATEKGMPIQWKSKKWLSQLANGAVHQGVVLVVSEFVYTALSEIIEKVSHREDSFILILAGLTDPHNFGSILRTADATNVDAVIIPKHRSVSVTPVVAKTATGALEHVPIVRVSSLPHTFSTLKKAGFWLFGADMAGVSAPQWETNGRISLVIGNEGKGLSDHLKNQMDGLVCVPMNGHVESLNASVAAAVLMYEVFRNRISCG